MPISCVHCGNSIYRCGEKGDSMITTGCTCSCNDIILQRHIYSFPECKNQGHYVSSHYRCINDTNYILYCKYCRSKVCSSCIDNCIKKEEHEARINSYSNRGGIRRGKGY